MVFSLRHLQFPWLLHIVIGLFITSFTIPVTALYQLKYFYCVIYSARDCFTLTDNIHMQSMHNTDYYYT